MPVRIAVDRDKCQGHGMCVMHAPNSFIIDADTGVAEVVPGARVAKRSSLPSGCVPCTRSRFSWRGTGK
jgi:ferredoxin